MLRVLSLVAAVLTTLVGSRDAAATLYRWVDSEGVVHLGNYQPSPTPRSTAAAPATEPCARSASVQPTAVIYGAKWCKGCQAARRFLGEHQVSFSYFDIEEDPDADARYRRIIDGGYPVVPLAVIGQKTIRGFNSTEYLRAICGPD